MVIDGADVLVKGRSESIGGATGGGMLEYLE